MHTKLFFCVCVHNKVHKINGEVSHNGKEISYCNGETAPGKLEKYIISLGCLAFTKQNGTCAEFDTRKLFSYAFVEGGKLPSS